MKGQVSCHGGAREEAGKLGAPFLGEVPLHMDIRTNSDAGTPVVASAPEGPHAQAYLEIAKQVHARIGEESGASVMPNIIFE